MTSIEFEEESERELAHQQEQRQVFVEQQKEFKDSVTPIIGKLQIVGQIQVQERFKIAIVTTERFRDFHKAKFSKFLSTELRWVLAKKQNIDPEHSLMMGDSYFQSDDCLEFDVWATGNTYQFIIDYYSTLVSDGAMSSGELEAIKRRVIQLPRKTSGLVHITFELVEGRMGSIFHFCDYKDSCGSHAVGVLKRQALVHNVLYSDTIQGAESICRSWKHQFMMKKDTLLVRAIIKQTSRAGHTINIQQLKLRLSFNITNDFVTAERIPRRLIIDRRVC